MLCGYIELRLCCMGGGFGVMFLLLKYSITCEGISASVSRARCEKCTFLNFLKGTNCTMSRVASFDLVFSAASSPSRMSMFLKSHPSPMPTITMEIGESHASIMASIATAEQKRRRHTGKEWRNVNRRVEREQQVSS
jgi:hypothetical protein